MNKIVHGKELGSGSTNPKIVKARRGSERISIAKTFSSNVK